MTATCACRDYFCSRGLVVDLIEQAFRDLHREIVFFCERAECACHSAAGGVENGGLYARQTFGQSSHERRIDDRLGVAVGVDNDPAAAGLALKPKCLRFSRQQIVHEFLEQETASRDVFGVFDFQLAVIFDKHRPAGGLEEQDWSLGVLE